jgi:hypothetical protein
MSAPALSFARARLPLTGLAPCHYLLRSSLDAVMSPGLVIGFPNHGHQGWLRSD